MTIAREKKDECFMGASSAHSCTLLNEVGNSDLIRSRSTVRTDKFFEKPLREDGANGI